MNVSVSDIFIVSSFFGEGCVILCQITNDLKKSRDFYIFHSYNSGKFTKPVTLNNPVIMDYSRL